MWKILVKISNQEPGINQHRNLNPSLAHHNISPTTTRNLLTQSRNDFVVVVDVAITVVVDVAVAVTVTVRMVKHLLVA